MKRPVTEQRTFCDLCGEEAELAGAECIICGKDICRKHEVRVLVEASMYYKTGARACLCIPDAKPLLPFLKTLVGKSTWRSAGHNGEYNEARLAELITLIEAA